MLASYCNMSPSHLLFNANWDFNALFSKFVQHGKFGATPRAEHTSPKVLNQQLGTLRCSKNSEDRQPDSVETNVDRVG